MTLEITTSIILTIIATSAPILLAALGELVVEKSGVLNLGVEGMMLMGAVMGFAVTLTTGSPWLGVLGAMCAGMVLSLGFGFLTLTLCASQVASGLALTLFGTGLSALIGRSYVGTKVDPFNRLFPADLAEGVLSRVVFGHSPIVYLTLVMVFAVSWFMTRTRAGLVLRASGESASSAHALGYPVIRVRYFAVLFGGAMAGIAGGFYSMVLTPLWAERLTAGRGWIALALVVFASWLPSRLAFGALLFGAVMTFELQAKAMGYYFVPPELLAALPYLATILALVFFSFSRSGASAAPGSLGLPFKPSR